MAIKDVLYATVANKCPRCHKGKVFENNNPYSFHNGVKMNIHCPSCGLKYERETGYFYGAMFVSYALQVGLFIVLFALNTLWWNLSSAIILSIIIASIIAVFPITFRWSRILWIGMFTAYDKDQVNSHVKRDVDIAVK